MYQFRLMINCFGWLQVGRKFAYDNDQQNATHCLWLKTCECKQYAYMAVREGELNINMTYRLSFGSHEYICYMFFKVNAQMRIQRLGAY